MENAKWISSVAVLGLLAPLRTDAGLELKDGMEKYKEYIVGGANEAGETTAVVYNIISPNGEHFKKDIMDLEKTYSTYEFKGEENTVYWFKGQGEMFVEFFNKTKK